MKVYGRYSQQEWQKEYQSKQKNEYSREKDKLLRGELYAEVFSELEDSKRMSQTQADQLKNDCIILFSIACAIIMVLK